MEPKKNTKNEPHFPKRTSPYPVLILPRQIPPSIPTGRIDPGCHVSVHFSAKLAVGLVDVCGRDLEWKQDIGVCAEGGVLLGDVSVQARVRVYVKICVCLIWVMCEGSANSGKELLYPSTRLHRSWEEGANGRWVY